MPLRNNKCKETKNILIYLISEEFTKLVSDIITENRKENVFK